MNDMIEVINIRIAEVRGMRNLLSEAGNDYGASAASEMISLLRELETLAEHWGAEESLRVQLAEEMENSAAAIRCATNAIRDRDATIKSLKAQLADIETAAAPDCRECVRDLRTFKMRMISVIDKYATDSTISSSDPRHQVAMEFDALLGAT